MASLSKIERAYDSRANADPFTENDMPSTSSEAFWASISLQKREENFASASRNYAEANEERANIIKSLGGDWDLAMALPNAGQAVVHDFLEHAKAGDVTRSPNWGINPTVTQAWAQMEDFAARFPDQVLGEEALREKMLNDSAALRAGEQDLITRGPWWAAMGGTAAGAIQDPVVAASMPFGASGLAGRTVLGGALHVAKVEGALAFGIEVPIQAQVYQYKREIEAPWTFRDSALNVVSASLGAGALGGTLAGGLQGTRKAWQAFQDWKGAGGVETPALENANHILQSTIEFQERNPFNFEIDGEVDFTPHAQAYDRALAQHQAHQPIDVRELVEPFEAPDPINDVLRRSEDPGTLVDIDPLSVDVDAKTFQFKSGGDGAGVTDTLKGVTKFDRIRAGVSLIWERADGKRFIADGHQRRGLAVRALEAGQDPAEVRLNGFILREADGVTALDARQMAAAKNIAAGHGSALDAAKVFRAGGPMVDALLPTLPPNSALVRQGRGLANLGDEQFMQVVNDAIDVRFGALIGGATSDPKLQQAMIDVIRRTKPANQTQARSIVDQVREVGTTTRVTEDLFGQSSITESLYLERAQALDVALREAKKDKAVFGRLLSEEDRITDAGQNRLDRSANLERLQEASDATTQITRLANTKGPVSEALTEAARQIKAGESPATAAQSFLKTARRTLLEGDRGGREAGGTGPGSQSPRTQGSIKLKKGQPVRLSELPPNERSNALTQVIDTQAQLSIGDIYARAVTSQKALAKAARKIVADLGEDVQMADPGIKKRSDADAKLGRKGKNPGELTDIVRLGFMVRTPEIAAEVVERLGKSFEVLDEGITVTGMGYIDHTALVRFDNGLVGEVQLWEPKVAAAKFGGAHDLYAAVRSISDDDLANDPALAARVSAAEEASKELYANALAGGSPEWRRTAMMLLPEDMRTRVQAAVEAGGSAGEPGNISKKALRDSSEPDSKISTGEARDQLDSPDATKSPSIPPPAVSRTAAGRASQLKNLSAIDAAPRSIVRATDDTPTPTPDATRTGTIPDTEYDAIMAKAQDLIDNSGELARVGNEFNGALETRSLSSALESLDSLEETLERIRICNLSGRSVA